VAHLCIGTVGSRESTYQDFTYGSEKSKGATKGGCAKDNAETEDNAGQGMHRRHFHI
jgi:hypothetical protein